MSSAGGVLPVLLEAKDIVPWMPLHRELLDACIVYIIIGKNVSSVV